MDRPEEAAAAEIHTPWAGRAHAADDMSTPWPLSVRSKAWYGIGEVSNSLKSFAFGLFLLFYYTSVLGMPGTLVGLATALSLIWDALIDPFIGHLSDRARFRVGRRHPFMIAGAIGMGVGFYAVFNPPAGLSPTALFVWLVASNIVLRTTNSVFTVPYYALGAELSQDYHERTSVTGFRAAFALLGTLLAAGASFAAFFPRAVAGVDPKFEQSGYTSMGLVFGIAITVSGLMAAVGTVSAGARRQPGGPPAVDQRIGFWPGLIMSLRNPSYLVLVLSTSIFFLASVINATLAVHYLTYYARITDGRALSLFQSSFYVGALAGVPMWVRVAKKVDKHRLYMGTTMIVALLMVAAYALVGEGHLFGTGRILPLVAGNSVGGFFASALWVIPASMIADVTDEDELMTGQRREGAYFGVHSFFLQESTAIALLAAGVLLDHFAGLVPGQIDQSAQTIHRVAMVFGLLPAMMYLGAALLMRGYRLTQRRVEAIQYALAQRRLEQSHARTSPDIRA